MDNDNAIVTFIPKHNDKIRAFYPVIVLQITSVSVVDASNSEQNVRILVNTFFFVFI